MILGFSFGALFGWFSIFYSGYYVISLLSITFTGSALHIGSSIVFFNRFLKISLFRMAQARLPERRPSSSDEMEDFFSWKGYRVSRSEVDSSPKVIQHEARDYILVKNG
jgi:hypothetical protein